MKLYNLSQNAIYINCVTIKHIIRDIMEEKLTQEELTNLSLLGGFDTIVGNYKYLVHISKIRRKTVYFTISIIREDSTNPVLKLFNLIILDADTLYVKKPLRVFRYAVYCPNLKNNPREAYI